MRDCLIILGMHRSGTSALAGAVHRLGVAIGSNIVEGQDDNIRGYYEHRGILELHEGLLAACGSAWDDITSRDWQAMAGGPAVRDLQRALKELLAAEFGDSALWVVKDPRLCHLLPLWLPVLADLEVSPRILFAHRSAVEVAGSLARRNGFSADKSNSLWVHHVVAAERASRRLPRAFVGFDQLLENPIQVLDRVARQLQIQWPQSPVSCAESLGGFVDPSLRHLPASHAPADNDELVAPLEEALNAAAENPLDEAAFDAVAIRRRELGTSNTLLAEHLHQFARREAETSVWEVKQALSRDLSAVSERLGAGIANVERALSQTQRARAEWSEQLGSQARLAEQLVSRAQLAEDRSVEAGRTLGHLSQVAASLESATDHQEVQLADLRARLDRLQHEVDIEDGLESLRRDLQHVAGRSDLEALRRDLERVAEQTRLLGNRRSWWRRAVDRLSFWRPRDPQPGTSTDA